MHLDHNTTMLIAEEKFELLRRDATTAARREHAARIRIGGWLVRLGLRLSGQPAVEREGLQALPPAHLSCG